MDKPTLLLALAFFFASAPNPDADAVAEMTANFIVPQSEFALSADERAPRPEEPIAPAEETGSVQQIEGEGKHRS